MSERLESNGGGEDEGHELTPGEQKQQKIERVKSDIEQIEGHMMMTNRILEN